MIEVVVDKRQTRRLQRMLRAIPGGWRKAAGRAINKIGVKARKQVLQMVTREVAVKQKDLRQNNVRLTRASRDRLYAVLSITGRRIPLMDFGARQVKRGVTYRISRSGGRKRIANAFVKTMPSGHEGVFKRLGQPRLPIRELMGPSVPAVVRNVQSFATGRFQDLMAGYLGKELQTQVELLLRKHAEQIGAAPF